MANISSYRGHVDSLAPLRLTRARGKFFDYQRRHPCSWARISKSDTMRREPAARLVQHRDNAINVEMERVVCCVNGSSMNCRHAQRNTTGLSLTTYTTESMFSNLTNFPLFHNKNKTHAFSLVIYTCIERYWRRLRQFHNELVYWEMPIFYLINWNRVLIFVTHTRKRVQYFRIIESFVSYTIIIPRIVYIVIDKWVIRLGANIYIYT